MTVDIPLSRGLVALVDDDDGPAVRQYRWHAIPGSFTWYAARWTRRSDGRSTTEGMHQFLTGYSRVDHVNGDGLDNRRSNLRQVTSSQNISNMRKHRGSSRFKGVSWVKRAKRWQAAIMVERRQRFLGYHVEEEAAAIAYDAAARKHFGEFAALNFPRPGERSALADVSALRIRSTTTTMWRKARHLQPVKEGGSDDCTDPS